MAINLSNILMDERKTKVNFENRVLTIFKDLFFQGNLLKIDVANYFSLFRNEKVSERDFSQDFIFLSIVSLLF